MKTKCEYFMNSRKKITSELIYYNIVFKIYVKQVNDIKAMWNLKKETDVTYFIKMFSMFIFDCENKNFISFVMFISVLINIPGNGNDTELKFIKDEVNKLGMK